MIKKFLILLLIVIFLAACSQPEQGSPGTGKLKVVATTTIVADVVSQVGGEMIELSVLLPPGMDPHGFEPTPQDVAKVAEADVVFANGAGLEEFLADLIESAEAEDKVTHLSDGVDFLMFEGGDHNNEASDKHEDGGVDPHTWTDPNNVIVWVRNVEHKLSEVDPENAGAYASSADRYITELEQLDAWIREQVGQLPGENREIVTDHTLFSYFVDEYGFEQVGALIPGYSSMAEPSAQELAEIEDTVSELGVKAIFVGNTVNPSLAELVAGDTGVRIIYVYTGSLSESGGDAGTYLEYMQYNTSAFVEALK